MTEVLLLLVKISVGALILAIGMGATVADLTYVWRRPGLLLRSLLAMYVLVPLAAFLRVKTWPLAPGVKAALLVRAVSAGAPLLPRKLQRFGSDAALHRSPPNGTCTRTSVPRWGSVLIVKLPPTSRTRSSRLISPSPPRRYDLPCVQIRK